MFNNKEVKQLRNGVVTPEYKDFTISAIELNSKYLEYLTKQDYFSSKDFNRKDVLNRLLVNKEKSEFVYESSVLKYTSHTNSLSWFLDVDLDLDYTEQSNFKKKIKSNLEHSLFENKLLNIVSLEGNYESFPTIVLENLTGDKVKMDRALEGFKKAIQIYYEVYLQINSGKRLNNTTTIDYNKCLKELKESQRKEDRNDALNFLEDFRVNSDKKFTDIGGYRNVKKQLKELKLYIDKTEVFKNYNLSNLSGILFHGHPGTGKTLAVKALAGELGANLYSIQSTDIFSMWLGQSEQNMKKILKYLPPNSILFIDEADSLFNNKDQNTHETSQKVLNLLLQYMDGVNEKEKATIIAATNRANTLEAAALRSGRFNKKIEFNTPDEETIEKIYEVHIKKFQEKTKSQIFSEDIDCAILAKESEGLVGADIGQIIEESAKEMVINYIEEGKEKPDEVNTDLILKQIKILKREII